MHPRYKPRLGHVVLIESSITDPDMAPISGTVVRVVDARIIIRPADVSHVPPPLGSRVVASHFAPEGMYRLTATVTPVDGSLVMEDCRHLQTVQRRQWPRRVITLAVTLADMGGIGDPAVRGETIDVSLGGARVVTASRISAPDDLLAALALPAGQTLLLAARVVASNVEGKRHEYRLAFCDLDDVEIGTLAALVGSQSAAVPVDQTC